MRAKLLRRIEEKLTKTLLQSDPQHILEEEINALLKKMTEDHQRQTDEAKEDVFLMALQIYKSHLNDLINKDKYTL